MFELRIVESKSRRMHVLFALGMSWDLFKLSYDIIVILKEFFTELTMGLPELWSIFNGRSVYSCSSLLSSIRDYVHLSKCFVPLKFLSVPCIILLYFPQTVMTEALRLGCVDSFFLNKMLPPLWRSSSASVTLSLDYIRSLLIFLTVPLSSM